MEPVVGPEVFETTARREVLEETGLDLTGVPLHYLTSDLYRGERDQPVLTVTYATELPDGPEPRLAAPDELSALGWFAPDELSRAENCAPWVLPLITAAGSLLGQA